jgi:hypothetical protein
MYEQNRPIVAYTELWTFRTEPTMGDVDLTGYKVEAADGSIGKVDEATYDVGGSYLIIDTGPWIFGKKVMLPAGVVERVDPENESIFVNRTKDEIKNAPEYDPNNAGEEYRGQLGEYYGRGGEFGRDDELAR